MNNYFFIGANPTCDLVIINDVGQVLLIKRSLTSMACPGSWALPGGFIDTTAKKGEVWVDGVETPLEAALRELKEETNLEIDAQRIVFLKVFEGGGRDPRDNDLAWSKSFAFSCFVSNEEFSDLCKKQKAMDDAIDIGWFSIDKINEMDIAFDHKKIIEVAINKKAKPRI